jgi:hypothetical protein
MCRFLGRRHDGAIDVFGRPASEKRQGTKSRSVLRRRFGGLYGDLARRRGVPSLDRSGCRDRFAAVPGSTRRRKRADCALNDKIAGVSAGESNELI